ncbi:hypothetical protein ABT008_08570 [Micromonospora sp. NPDC002389]
MLHATPGRIRLVATDSGEHSRARRLRRSLPGIRERVTVEAMIVERSGD